MPITPSATNLPFGTWPATTKVEKTVTLSGATGTVTAQVSGAGAAAFTASVVSATEVKVTFDTASIGGFTATLTLTDSANATAPIALSGTAKANALTFTPASLSFGNVVVGALTNLSVAVQNPGPLDATLSAPSGPFSLPVTTVPAGQTLTIQVFFKPAATGPASAQVSSAWMPPAEMTGVTLATLASELAVGGNGVTTLTADNITPPAGQTGERQRLKIDVPNPPAQMTLGARVLDTSTADASAIIDGFGLGTPGHGFLNAKGSSSNLWMRAMKSLVLESRDSDGGESSEGIWMVSKGNLAATCGGTASFIGAGGVVIAANKGPAPGEDGDPVNADSPLDDPPKTNTAEERQGIASTAAIAFGAIDAIIAFGFGVRGLYNLIKGSIEDSKMPFTSLAATVGLAGAVGGFTGFSMGVSGLAGKVSGVTIYGEAGVVIGSGGFTGIHSISSLVMSSVFPLMFGVDAEIFAVDALTLTGMRHAVLASHKDVAVQSDGDIKIKANGGGFGPIGTERLGKIEVLGKHSIRLEAAKPFPPQTTFLEAKPAGISADASHTFDVVAGTSNELNAVNQAKLSMKSAQADLRVGSYGVQVKPDKAAVQKILPNGAADPAGPNLVVRDTNIAMRYGNQGAVGITNAGVVKLLAGGQQHKITMGPATVTIQSGARILLQ